jgi:hypothetical protein
VVIEKAKAAKDHWFSNSLVTGHPSLSYRGTNLEFSKTANQHAQCNVNMARNTSCFLNAYSSQLISWHIRIPRFIQSRIKSVWKWIITPTRRDVGDVGDLQARVV